MSNFNYDFFFFFDGEDIELVVHVLSWTPGKPSYISRPPEDCYPDEPAEIEWTAEYPDGRSAESLLTPEEAERIEAEAILRMSELDTAERESYRYDERDQFAYGDEE